MVRLNYYKWVRGDEYPVQGRLMGEVARAIRDYGTLSIRDMIKIVNMRGYDFKNNPREVVESLIRELYVRGYVEGETQEFPSWSEQLATEQRVPKRRILYLHGLLKRYKIIPPHDPIEHPKIEKEIIQEAINSERKNGINGREAIREVLVRRYCENSNEVKNWDEGRIAENRTAYQKARERKHERLIRKWKERIKNPHNRPRHRLHYSVSLEMLDNPIAYSYVLERLAHDFYIQNRQTLDSFPLNLYLLLMGVKRRGGLQDYIHGQLERLLPHSPVNDYMDFQEFEKNIFMEFQQQLNLIASSIKELFGGILDELAESPLKSDIALGIYLRGNNSPRIASEMGVTKAAAWELVRKGVNRLRKGRDSALDELLFAVV